MISSLAVAMFYKMFEIFLMVIVFCILRDQNLNSPKTPPILFVFLLSLSSQDVILSFIWFCCKVKI